MNVKPLSRGWVTKIKPQRSRMLKFDHFQLVRGIPAFRDMALVYDQRESKFAPVLRG